MNWVSEFCPKEFDDFVDLSYLKEFLEKWIKGGDKEGIWKPLLLIGGKESGKKTIARLLFEKYGYNIVNMDYNDTYKNFKEIFLKHLTNQNIINAFFGRKDKKAIIIPNLECYIENNEKGVLNDIISIFNIKKRKTKEKQFLKKIDKPIILTTSDEYSKKIKNIKKFCNCVNINRPDAYQLLKLLCRICKNKKIKLTKKQQMYIIKKSNGRYVDLIKFMNEIWFLKKRGYKIKEKINYVVENMSRKNHNYAFDYSISLMFQKKMSIIELTELFSQENFMIPLMMFENYPYYFEHCGITDNKEKVKKGQYLLTNYCLSDRFQTKCFKQQSWLLLDYCVFFSGFTTNRVFATKEVVDTKEIVSGIGNIYSSLLNKFSLKKTYKKMKINSYFNYEMEPRELQHILEVILFNQFDKNGLRKKAKLIKNEFGWNINDLKKIGKNFQLLNYKKELLNVKPSKKKK
jgi:hypothetical protein